MVAVAVALAMLASACASDDPVDITAPAPGTTARTVATFDTCDWPMWGYDVERSFTTACPTAIDAGTVAELGPEWFFDTRDVVTATPAVVDGTVYVGDWSGRFYAIDAGTGTQRWAYDTEVHPTVYSGQVVSSAAVADTPTGQVVVFGAGRSVYALDAREGALRWRHDVNPSGGPDDSSEVQSSPLVFDGRVFFGFDGHNEPGVRAGVKALDLATGDELWYFDPDEGGPARGCAGVWGSPTVDASTRTLFFGTASCRTAPEGWSEYSEALVALDADTGEPLWSFQPHAPANLALDFAGAPNLFDVDDVPAVGLGNKDGSYYAVDRAGGDLIWSTDPPPADVADGSFGTGGFIGPTAVSGSVIVGGTAVSGDCPCLHALGTDGQLLWQQAAAGPTFAATAATDELAFVGSTTDFTLRAVSLDDGEVLWQHEMPAAVAGGVAITADRVVAVSGIRQPGLEGVSEASGVSSFALNARDADAETTQVEGALPPIPTAPPPTEVPPSVPGDDRPCVREMCELPFVLREPPPGTTPEIMLHVRPAPFRLEVRSAGLGPPEAWLRAGSEAAGSGAVAYGVFVSVSDDNPAGALVCLLDPAGGCVTEALPDLGAESYNRVTILAIADSVVLPSPGEGFDRMVTTTAFDPPLVLTDTAPNPASGVVVFSGQGNDLVAYEAEPPFASQTVITNATDDPGGRDINGQICFDPDDARRFVAGEDTDQGGAGAPGWGIFELSGDQVGDFAATQVAKLVPTYQSATDNAENFGCGFLPDGRIVTTDIGNQAAGEGNGQLIVWFPPFGFGDNSYCKVDVGLATGQAILVTEQVVLVAQARAPGVFSYDIDAMPTGADAAGGCDTVDDTGAPLSTAVTPEPFIVPTDTNGIVAPSGLAAGPDGTIFVSSVINGVIGAFGPDGTHVGVVVRPPDGETLGAEPFTSGTPLGLGVDSAGTLYYADIAVVVDENGVGPGSGLGTVRRLLPGSGEPEIIDDGLRFPDGIGVYEPSAP